MKTPLTLLLLLNSFSAFSTTDQCPKLAGRFSCKGVEGSHKDMTLEIQQAITGDYMTYSYTYLQQDTPPLTLTFFASNEGTKNPSQNDMIGKCLDQKYFNSKDGTVGPKTFFNVVNDKGEYQVIQALDEAIYLTCPPI